MSGMVDEETRQLAAEWLEKVVSEPAFRAEAIDQLSHWMLAGGMVIVMAQSGVRLPADMHEGVRQLTHELGRVAGVAIAVPA